jgi:uncharacterized membrane protein (DUF106 family)
MGFEWLTIIPYSTLFVLLLAFAVSFATQFTSRLLTNKEQLQAWNKEISQWRSAIMEARRRGDKRAIAKLQRQERHVMQLQSKIMWQSMKTSLLWFIPLMLMWYVFLPYLGFSINAIVAYIPLLSEPPFELSVFLWYLFCSFLASALFTRLFGLGLGLRGG